MIATVRTCPLFVKIVPATSRRSTTDIHAVVCEADGTAIAHGVATFLAEAVEMARSRAYKAIDRNAAVYGGRSGTEIIPTDALEAELV